jgi:NO-binding membrane sensor protein with MHYT domain/anti-sigma regulatory factor (Ser/Thr protein kinase)
MTMLVQANLPMRASYDALQVALSILIAVSASYAALDLGGRVTVARGRPQLIWLLGGTISVGIGIWAMHYTGMFAFRLPMAVRYHWPTVLLSLLVGMLCSGFALMLVSRRRMGRLYTLIGSVILASGIAGLHHTEMKAMRFAGVCHFNSHRMIPSVLLAIGFSVAALWLGFYFRDEPKGMVWRKLGAASVMGGAIAAMHYSGMAAVSFLPFPLSPVLSHTVSVSSLGALGISTVTLLVLGLAVLSCAVDRRFDERKLELALSQAQVEVAHLGRVGMLGELAASIAHEVNQPLSAITLNASASLQWLSMEPPKLAEARQALSDVLREAKRASDIIARIRAMLKKVTPERALVDANEVVGQVLSLVASELTKAGVTVKTELAPGTTYVRGDRVQLQQVLLNLVVNAIEAMSGTNAPRELLIKTLNVGDRVVVQVEDTGPGLDAAQAKHVFEPFYTTKSKGLGMGLSISRSIIESHGGHLSARPRPSRGTIFEFTLPAANVLEEKVAS